jgi:MoaA/NifB/PqqE/SkfB family radical SAM enzyme
MRRFIRKECGRLIMPPGYARFLIRIQENVYNKQLCGLRQTRAAVLLLTVMFNKGTGALKNRIANIRLLRNLRLTHFKKFDGRLRAYLTLHCNLRCAYCVNRCFEGTESRISEYPLSSADEWISAINRQKRHVVFTGGEPTLHPEFIEILNGIDQNLEVTVYTNFQWSGSFLRRFLSRAGRTPVFYGSYHPSSGGPGNFLHVLKTLKDNGKFRGSLHAIDLSQDRHFLKEAVSIIESEGFGVKLDSDQSGLFDCSGRQFRKRVECLKQIILIAPDGYRYPCVSKMVRRQNTLENIFTEPVGPEKITTICGDYGYCAPCDGLGSVTFKLLK